MTDNRLKPLVVDLDGTLTTSDSLVEAMLSVLFQRPETLVPACRSLLKGRASFKQFLADLGVYSPNSLPLRDDLLAYLVAEQKAGRQLHLATAANQSVADGIAARVGIFSSALGSSDGVNVKGKVKLAHLKERFPDGFSYAGNDRSDLHVWSEATSAVIVNASEATRRAARKLGTPVEREFPAQHVTFREWSRAVRIHQWSKNLLLFVPLLLAHRYHDVSAILTVLVGFLCMGLVASGTYLLNDLSDLDADRAHITKRNRAVASGAISAGTAVVLALVLMGGGLVGGTLLNLPFAGLLLAYCTLTLSYSLRFKRTPMFDVFLLGSLYTLRVFMGIVLIDAPVSPWLVTFSLFFFFSLAMAKRHVEIARAGAASISGLIKGRGYTAEDAPLTLTFGISSGLVAILILFLYVANDAYPMGSYKHPEWLWLTGFLVFLWLSRIWLLSSRRELDDDPVAFAVDDPLSWFLGALMLGILLMAVL